MQVFHFYIVIIMLFSKVENVSVDSYSAQHLYIWMTYLIIQDLVLIMHPLLIYYTRKNLHQNVHPFIPLTTMKPVIIYTKVYLRHLKQFIKLLNNQTVLQRYQADIPQDT